MSVHYSAAVEKAIAEVCPPRDAFDAADFDPVEYLNSRFPDENSLSALPAFLDETNKRLRQTESDLLKAVESQAVNADVADSDLKAAKQSVAELYVRVAEIKTKAAESEETVKELCQHIRELDIAKTNLTASINTLRSIQLWMLQLQVLSSSFERKRYIQCRDALQEAQKYSSMFEKMNDMAKVKELNDKQGQICRQIEYYIRNTVFADISLENVEENTMAEACAIIDLMGPEIIKKIRDRFIEKVLETYTTRFRRGTDDATLARTERRYVYIRTLLENYDSMFKNVFPRQWCVPQELCVTFCIRTKQELDFQLQESANNMDVVVLTYILEKTIDIERDLTLSLAWKEEFPGMNELPVYKYNGMILSAFREHMDLFVQNEDKLMSEALSQPLIGEGDAACQGWKSEDEETRVGTALPLAEDIFVFIKESLKRSLRIAQQDVLLDMAGVWRKHLVRFAKSVTTVLPDPAVQPLQTRRACILINTADFCQSTSQNLGEEVCARSEAPPKDVAFDQVVDAFSSVYSQSVMAIVHGVEFRMAPLLIEYGNGGYMNVKKDDELNSGGTHDESRLVRAMATVLHDTVVYCAALLPTLPLRFVLNKIAATIIPLFTNTLYRQRRLSDDAVASMRVDAAALEKTFLQLPNYNDPNRYQPAALSAYIKLVRKEFDPLHRALKVLQVEARNNNAFMDLYYELTLPDDRSIQNFVRLVELKGLKREEVRGWITSLSKRGVVEATQRDLQREAMLGLATGTSGPTAAAVGGGGGGGGGITFAALFSRDGGAVAGGGIADSASSGGGGGGGNSNFFSNLVSNIGNSRSTEASAVKPAREGKEEESLGSRFTLTSMGILNKFKRSEGKS